MTVDGLLHAAWDRKMVRDFCDLVYTPSIFDCLIEDKNGFKMNEEYIKGKKKADEMFENIMASPEKIKAIVNGYTRFLREKRIGELESELEALKNEE